jgi:hypothetical protein
MYDVTLGIFVYIKQLSAPLELKINSSHNLLAPNTKIQQAMSPESLQDLPPQHLAIPPPRDLRHLISEYSDHCHVPTCMQPPQKIQGISTNYSTGRYPCPQRLPVMPQHFAPDQATISQAKAKGVFLASTSKSPPPIASLHL